MRSRIRAARSGTWSVQSFFCILHFMHMNSVAYGKAYEGAPKNFFALLTYTEMFALLKKIIRATKKNTINELSDTITGGKDIGLWSSNIPENIREYLLKNEKLILKHDVPQHRKDRNLSRKWSTNLIRRQNHNAEVVEVKTLWKLALFFSFTNLCLLFHL